MIKFEYRTSYNHEWQTCGECYAVFSIYSQSMSPDKISHILQLNSTEQHMQGEDVPTPWGKTVKSPQSCWFLSSQNKLHSKDLRAHLQWLLDIIQPISFNIKTLQEVSDIQMHIKCIWISRYGDGGPSLWPEQLQQMAFLGLPCYFDFYCQEPMFTEPLVEIPTSHKDWNFGYLTLDHMKKRGWVLEQIQEAIITGRQLPANNHIHKDNGAIRYIHPQTGKSIIIDMVTRELIHIGKKDFLYPSDDRSFPEDLQDYIFVRLLNEGTTVYRPVKAFSKQEDIYFIDNTVLLDYQDEEWEFKPGSYVHVNREFLANGEYIVAGKEFFSEKIRKIFN